MPFPWHPESDAPTLPDFILTYNKRPHGVGRPRSKVWNVLWECKLLELTCISSCRLNELACCHARKCIHQSPSCKCFLIVHLLPVRNSDVWIVACKKAIGTKRILGVQASLVVITKSGASKIYKAQSQKQRDVLPCT